MIRYLFVLLLLLTALAPAQDLAYDGLKIIGVGKKYTDDQNASLTMMGCLTKYKDQIVGMYFLQGPNEIHYYMNATDWDKMKQLLIKSRDQWQTIQSREFEALGPVPGYRIANKVTSVRFSLLGATSLDTKQLLINANGGLDKPQRVSIHLNLDQVKALVEEFYKVDDWFRSGGQKPTP
ncbi:hypothetical protein IV102_23285 [bacterium]|nr:hypothetical protein [bacterium]